jgi:hypothetical protein
MDGGRSWTRIGRIAPVVVGVGLVVTGCGPRPDEHGSAPGQAPTCVASPVGGEPGGPGSAPGAVGASQVVTVVVPPTVRAWPAPDGSVIVRTNARRAPAAGDQVWVQTGDGTFQRADDATTAALVGATWRDDRGRPAGTVGGSWCDPESVHRSAGSLSVGA